MQGRAWGPSDGGAHGATHEAGNSSADEFGEAARSCRLDYGDAGRLADRPLKERSSSWQLARWYGDLFGWTCDTPSPVAQEVSQADSYGFIDLLRSDDGIGIRGGIGGGEGYDSHAVFYVGAPDVEAALQRAESLGGTRVMGPATSPNGLVVGRFKDPEGTLIGVAGVG
jgi:uncharacterized protein